MCVFRAYLRKNLIKRNALTQQYRFSLDAVQRQVFFFFFFMVGQGIARICQDTPAGAERIRTRLRLAERTRTRTRIRTGRSRVVIATQDNASLYVSNSGVGSHICSYSALLFLAFCRQTLPYIATLLYRYIPHTNT